MLIGHYCPVCIAMDAGIQHLRGELRSVIWEDRQYMSL